MKTATPTALSADISSPIQTDQLLLPAPRLYPPVEIRSDKLRAYEIDGHYYPSVTSILSFVFGMPPEMANWIARNSALRALREKRFSDKYKLKATQDSLVKLALTERWRLLKESSVKGVTVHQWAEDYFNGLGSPDEVPKPLQGYWDSFQKWTEFYHCEPILQEEVLYSHTYKYAGRMDFYGRLRNGKYVLIDFKTSNFLKWDYGLQLAAYKECLTSLGYPVDECYILHLKSHGMYEFVRFDKPFSLFLATRQLFADKVKDEHPEFELAQSPTEYLKQNGAL